jgi:plastocyanin
MRRLLLPLALLAAALAIPAASSGDHRAAKTITVKVGDDYFSPTKKTIHIRDIVRWQWVGEDRKPGSTINEHTIVDSKQDKPYFKNSKTKTKGTFSVRFKKTGTFRVICADHPDDMKITVKVKD